MSSDKSVISVKVVRLPSSSSFVSGLNFLILLMESLIQRNNSSLENLTESISLLNFLTLTSISFSRNISETELDELELELKLVPDDVLKEVLKLVPDEFTELVENVWSVDELELLILVVLADGDVVELTELVENVWSVELVLGEVVELSELVENVWTVELVLGEVVELTELVENVWTVDELELLGDVVLNVLIEVSVVVVSVVDVSEVVVSEVVELTELELLPEVPEDVEKVRSVLLELGDVVELDIL